MRARTSLICDVATQIIGCQVIIRQHFCEQKEDETNAFSEDATNIRVY